MFGSTDSATHDPYDRFYSHPIDDMTISCRTHCICPLGTARKCTQRRQAPGSNAFVPSVAGLIIAGEVIKDLSGYAARARQE